MIIHTKTGVGKDDTVMKFARIEKINGAFWDNDVAGRLVAADEDFGKELNDNIDEQFDNITSVRIARCLDNISSQLLSTEILFLSLSLYPLLIPNL